MNYLDETRRRRTFAIISHPDAGKTTLTENLLLAGGAIRAAGAVRAGVVLGALAGVNGLRVADKAGAKLGECLQRRGQPAAVAGLDPVDWAYVLVRLPARPRHDPRLVRVDWAYVLVRR